jgi:hypothetical protein
MKEMEVEVKLIRWLGRPKEYASHTSTVAKHDFHHAIKKRKKKH